MLLPYLIHLNCSACSHTFDATAILETLELFYSSRTMPFHSCKIVLRSLQIEIEIQQGKELETFALNIDTHLEGIIRPDKETVEMWLLVLKHLLHYPSFLALNLE